MRVMVSSSRAIRLDELVARILPGSTPSVEHPRRLYRLSDGLDHQCTEYIYSVGGPWRNLMERMT